MRFIKKNLNLWVMGLLLMGSSLGFGAASRAVMEEEAAAEAAGQGPVGTVAHVAPGDDQPSRREESEEAAPSGTQAQGGNPFVHINRLTLAEFQERYKFTPGQVTFLDLPPNVIFLIANHLNPSDIKAMRRSCKPCWANCSLSVCAWLGVIKGPTLLETMIQRGPYEHKSVVTFDQVPLGVLENLTVLNLTSDQKYPGGWPHSNTILKVLKVLGPKCPQVRELDLSGHHPFYLFPDWYGGFHIYAGPTKEEIASFAGILASFSSVEKLNLAKSTLSRLPSESMQLIFSQFSNLKELDLSENKLNDDQLPMLLEHLTELQKLCLKHTFRGDSEYNIQGLASSLKKLSKLRVLDLSENNLGNNISEFLPVFEELVFLKRLDLSFNNLGLQEMGPLVQILQKLPDLEGLSLESNYYVGFDHNNFVEAFVPGLQRLTHLKMLNLAANDFWDGGLEALIPAIEKLTSLEELYLNDLDHRPRGIEALIPTLKKLTRLKRVALSDSNSDRVDMIEALMPALSFWPHLESLDLCEDTKSYKEEECSDDDAFDEALEKVFKIHPGLRVRA